ncbi:MAG: flagellar M-ring protein FliF [Tatlockia sp.]|nr:flagellar M-ring protein FliF [Tatlockia sp.]
MNYFSNAFYWFKNQTQKNQIQLLLGLTVIFSLALGLCLWLNRPNYAVLFSNLDKRDASQIINNLEQNSINYRLNNAGDDISIDKNLVAKTRIKLLSTGMQLSGSVGFELFDKNDFGLTDFSQKINFQRALQGELERTISSLDEVKQARVHLVIPDQHLFQQEENQPRAAISLNLIHPLSSKQVSGIQQLVTASVAHMQKAKVVILDQNGYKLTGGEEDPGSKHFTTKKNLEHYLNGKVLDMLTRVFKNEEFMVKIDVTLNYDQIERELVKPQHDAVLIHEKESRHTSSTKIENPLSDQDLTSEKSYHFGTRKEHFTHASGNIERLTISVVLPQYTEKSTLLQIERLVKSVIGFDAKRGDSISIETLVNESKLLTIPSLPITKQERSFDFNFPIGLSLISGFLIFISSLKVFNRRRKRKILLSELTDWLAQYD